MHTYAYIRIVINVNNIYNYQNREIKFSTTIATVNVYVRIIVPR
jgi:hypothetical protein